jgi:hypothetical protein
VETQSTGFDFSFTFDRMSEHQFGLPSRHECQAEQASTHAVVRLPELAKIQSQGQDNSEGAGRKTEAGGDTAARCVASAFSALPHHHYPEFRVRVDCQHAASLDIFPVNHYRITLQGEIIGSIVADSFETQNDRVVFYRSGNPTATYLERFVQKIEMVVPVVRPEQTARAA